MERLPDATLTQWLHEDAPWGDLTSQSLGLGPQPAQVHFAARGDMRVAATEEAARLFELCGCEAEVLRPSGADAGPGEPLLRAQGPAGGALRAWKVAQNAVEVASGVASEAARMLRLLREAGHPQALACTRKTWPGGRALAVRGVLAGGAVMHRLGLSETLLVFPEHRAFIPPDRLAAGLQQLRLAQPEKKLVAETGSPDEAMALARAGVEVLQLERFTPDALAALKQDLRAAGLSPLLAPAGGITATNLLAYAAAGADFLVSSAPYLAAPRDVKVHITGLAPVGNPTKPTA